MCTSRGDKKILMTVGESALAVVGPIRVTRPSAGETTTSGSFGGTRLGSRKKKAMKSAMTKSNAATYQNPNTAAATPSNAGTKIYGTLSLTIPNSFLCAFVAKPALWLKGDAYF